MDALLDISRQQSQDKHSSKRPGSVYREALDKEIFVTFPMALDVAWKVIHGFDKSSQDKIYESLDRGKAILTSEEQCAGYMVWFAKKHLVKFTAAFDLLPKNICQNVIDVIDWGCGIGLASFALRDWYDRMFPARKYCKKIRRVTLIEPSGVALEWSSYNARRCFPEAKVLEVRKKFSELEGDDFGDTGNPTQCRLHIFSNVLDMNVVRGNSEMSSLAEKVKSNALGWDDLLVLISPDYANVEAAFASFVHLLSDGSTDYDVIQILEPRKYSWSKDEGDNVGAKGVLAVWQIRSKTKGAMLQGLSPNWRTLYDRLALDDSAGAEERKLVDFLHENLKGIPDTDIGLRYRPNVYGMTPDVVIFRKDYLPVFISIGKRNSLDESTVEPNNQFMEPAEAVRRELVKNNKTLFNVNEAFGLISVFAYSPALNKLGAYKGKVTGEDDKKVVAYEWKTGIQWKRVISDAGLSVRQAIRELLITKKRLPEVTVLNLDKKQQKLSVSRPGMQKVKGCFGSGKTTVLIERAISAYRRTHRRVLILTYNISLRNHIEHAISQRIDMDLTGREFLILNIHQFIRTHGMPFVSPVKKNVVDFLDNGKDALEALLAQKNSLTKFATILVDESQDFEYYWMEILTKVFLEPGGEYVLFGDEKQNVYGRELDDKETKTNIPARASELDQCHRSFGKLLDYILKFQTLMPKYSKDTINTVLALDNSVVEYHLLEHDDIENGVSLMRAKLEDWDVPLGEVTVLAESHAILREIEVRIRNSMGLKTEVMFWRSEEMANAAARKNRDERDLKLFFDGDQTERMKFSTIESFKGFESSCVFLFIESYIGRKNAGLMELIYAGITRAKQRLVICNMGNATMHSAFRDNGLLAPNN